MRRSGAALGEIYVHTRGVLLDVIEALGDQRDAVVLVGAQAVYLRTGNVDAAVAPFTTDGDLVLDLIALLAEPLLES